MSEFTTKQAAEKFHCDESTIQKWAKRIGIKKRGRDYLFTASDMKTLARSIHPTPGNPNWIAAGKKKRK